jgi:hypothetical protein
MSNLDLRMKQHIDQKNEFAQEATEDLFNAMIVEGTNNVLPEHIFTQYFLPYFAGKLPITKETTVMVDWVSVAGSPVAEVDIIDGNRNVLYTVPSLFDTKMINPSRSADEESLGQIYGLYSLKTNNLPIIADRYLNNALDEKTDVLIDSSLAKDTRWDDILTRYDMQPIDAKTQNAMSSKLHEVDDDLIYE